MTQFNGLVKAKYEDLVLAIDNWNKVYEDIQSKYKELLLRSREETIKTKFLWFFTVEENKYDYIVSNTDWHGKYWTPDDALIDLYPDEYTKNMRNIRHKHSYFSDIKAMVKVSHNDVYLSSEQAAKVVEWGDK